MSERVHIMNFGIQWPPYTHGRVVCRRCTTVVAACSCAEACRTVGTIEGCVKCTPAQPSQLRYGHDVTPATKYHDSHARYANDARYHAAVDHVVALELKLTPGEIYDVALTASIVMETKYARPMFVAPASTRPGAHVEDPMVDNKS